MCSARKQSIVEDALQSDSAPKFHFALPPRRLTVFSDSGPTSSRSTGLCTERRKTPVGRRTPDSHSRGPRGSVLLNSAREQLMDRLTPGTPGPPGTGRTSRLPSLTTMLAGLDAEDAPINPPRPFIKPLLLPGMLPPVEGLRPQGTPNRFWRPMSCESGSEQLSDEDTDSDSDSDTDEAA